MGGAESCNTTEEKGKSLELSIVDVLTCLKATFTSMIRYCMSRSFMIFVLIPFMGLNAHSSLLGMRVLSNPHGIMFSVKNFVSQRP